MESPPWKLAIFVDLASVQSFTDRSDTDLNYGRVLSHLADGRALVRAAAYGTVDADQPGVNPHMAWMQRNGYKLITKPLRRREDGTMRASVHVNMTVDALELAPRLDVLALVTIDPDLVPLVEAVQRRGVRVELVTPADARPGSLIDVADEIRDLESVLAAPSQPSAGRGRSEPRRAPERRTARPAARPTPAAAGPEERRESRPRPRRGAPPSVQTDGPDRPRAVPARPGETATAMPPARTDESDRTETASAGAGQDETAADRPSSSRPLFARLPQERLSGRSVSASDDKT